MLEDEQRTEFTQARLTPSERNQLDELAKKMGTYTSTLVRMAIIQFLKRQSQNITK